MEGIRSFTYTALQGLLNRVIHHPRMIRVIILVPRIPCSSTAFLCSTSSRAFQVKQRENMPTRLAGTRLRCWHTSTQFMSTL
ncbi:hypothetical protein CC2G_008815 [Coprinopsis cinerea AmutBmut pab1-1]|nr:hypothetical protein CC2G_008815 [Coprinopsis cinerea AmutBmut pab1-1]